MLKMKNKKRLITIAVAIALVAVLGTTVAFAADDDETSRGFGRFGNGDAGIYSQEELSELVEEGVITQDEADIILSGGAHLYDFIDHEDCEECELVADRLYARGTGNMYSEQWLSELVSDGVITQEQADSILSGGAHLYDFISYEECEEYGEGLYIGGYHERGISRGGHRQGRKADS